jgi:hypothetical protein
MNWYWSNLYDSFKDRRYGGLFLSTVLAMIASLVLGAVIGLFDRQIDIPYVLPGIGLLAAAWMGWSLRRALMRSREKLRHGPLSRDELRVARSKLRNERKLIQRPPPRAPDTNLKY